MVERFVNGAALKGWVAGGFSRSKNRVGGYSVYFNISKKVNKRTLFATCRISDHTTASGTHMIGYAGAYDGAAIDALVTKLSK